jgi:hypothetical protein
MRKEAGKKGNKGKIDHKNKGGKVGKGTKGNEGKKITTEDLEGLEEKKGISNNDSSERADNCFCK